MPKSLEKYRTVIRYVLVGGTAYFLEVCVIFALISFNISEVLAVAISFWVGLIVSFVLQKLIAFRDKAVSPKRLLKQSLMYGALVAINYAFTLIFVFLTEPIMGVFAARTVALVITTSWNYLAYSKIIFNPGSLRTINPDMFQRILLAISLILLISSSVYVSYKSGIVHSNNHDQLINVYMMETLDTFQGSIFPGAHTQLLKWPIFALDSVLGSSHSVFIATTMVLYLITVLFMAWVAWIFTGKNKLYTTLIVLALSNILALVPVQPNPGALLPVNMAMLATRNIEYVLFIILLAVVIRKRNLYSAPVLLSAFGLAVLGASDKLFAILPLIIAIAILLVRFVKNRHDIKRDALLLFLMGAVYVLSGFLLWAIDALGITNIAGTQTSSPYPLINSFDIIAEAMKGLVRAIAAIFGALIPPSLTSRLFLVSYLLNCVLAIACIAALVWCAKSWFLSNKNKTKIKLELLAWVSIGSLSTIALFTLTQHEYRSDARYIGLFLFAGILALSFAWRNYQYRHKDTLTYCLIALMFLIAPVTFFASREQLNHSIHATSVSIGDRINVASKILIQEKTTVLTGDYWFSVPVRLSSNNLVRPVPMSTGECETLNSYLTSKTWDEPSQTTKRSAVYILRDAGENAETFNHGCSMEFLDRKYGAFEREYVIRGTKQKPIDIIRIYNYDVREKISR